MGHSRWLFAWAVLALAVLVGDVRADGTGRVKCEILENAKPASGTLALEQGGKIVVQGACGDAALSAPAGSYTAILSLDGALDAPQQRRPAQVEAGKTGEIKADFATATLKVVIESEGRRAAGMAIIRRAGKQIGTLGSGVSAHLSAGSYEITARYHAQQRDFGAITLAAGEDKVLEARFE